MATKRAERRGGGEREEEEEEEEGSRGGVPSSLWGKKTAKEKKNERVR